MKRKVYADICTTDTTRNWTTTTCKNNQPVHLFKKQKLKRKTDKKEQPMDRWLRVITKSYHE